MENEFIKTTCNSIKEVWKKENSFSELRNFIELELGFRNIGRGSSRIVYSLGEDLVLKLAINKRGTAQNESESKIYTESGSELPILNDIISYDEEYFIYEIQNFVKQINGKKIQKMVGVDWFEIEDALYGIDRSNISAEEAIKFYTNVEEGDSGYETVFNILTGARVLKTKYKIEVGDMTKANSYGVDKNGMLKLIDYGLTSDVWNKFYK